MNIRNTHLINLDKDPTAPNIDKSLMIYKNAQRESYDSVCGIPTPTATRTHLPIPNSTFINLTANHIHSMDWQITGSTYASSYEQGNAHFVFEINHQIIPGVQMQIAGHNSHIKMRSAILYMQTRTSACTNMDCPAEIPLQRKHTNRILEQLSELIANALVKLNTAAQEHHDRLDRYKYSFITDTNARDLMIQAMDEEIVPSTYLPSISNDWNKPAEAFTSRNLYSLYNCFTESFKRSPADTPNRTQKLITLLDNPSYQAA